MKRLATIMAITALGGLSIVLETTAAEAGSTRIIGSYRQTTIVDTVVNEARGRNARAGVSIGTVHSGQTLFGTHNSTIKVGRVVNRAGRGETSCIHIGSYGRNPAC
jgi:hypothetical protein